MSAMASSFATRLVTVISAVVGLWALLLSVPEVMRWEHELQKWVKKMVDPMHEFEQGNGSHSQPYRHARWQQVAPGEKPWIVAMGDDPERIFDSNPLSPSDVAVLLDTLSHLGVRELVIHAPMVWEQPDPFALAALEFVMDQFPACITTADLQRAAQDQEMPLAIKRSSVPWKMVREPRQDLVVMNALVFPDTMLGKEYPWAGFSSTSGAPHEENRALLMARWGDRVIFSSSFLAVLLHHDIHPKELIIEPGQGIHCPRTGHFWAMDRFGRSTIRAGDVIPAEFQATQLIRAEELTQKRLREHRSPLHLMAQYDQNQAMAMESRLLASLRQEPLLLDVVTWSRLPVVMEFVILVICALQFLLLMNFPFWVKLFAVVLVATQWFMALSIGETWIPLSPILLAMVLAWWLSPHRLHQRRNRRKRRLSRI
jgi:hypothetical protein